MIHLTSLLFEQTKESDDVVLENPNVLFIGDTYTRSKSSYARKLLDTNSIRGKIVSWPNISLKQMAKLITRYSNSDKFDIVSILFGDSVTKHTDLEKLKKQLDAVINSAGSINTIVVVRNPKQQYTTFSGALDLIDGLNVDATVSSGNDLTSPDTQSTIATNWLNDVKALGYNLEVTTKKKDANATSGAVESPTNQINANFSDSTVNQAYDMILPFEGFTPIAKKDTDGYCRIGHGSSHITRADGTIITLGKPIGGKSCAETYTYTIEPEDAHRDLRRLISNVFIPLVTKKIKQWGGDVSKFNEATIATLVSVAYNYGHIPDELKPGISANDAQLIGNTLLTQFNSPGSNPKRRKKEGQYILNSLNAQPDATQTVIPGSLTQADGTINIVPSSIPADSDGSNNTINSAETIDQQNAIQKLGLIVPVPGRRGYGTHRHPKDGNPQMHWGIDFANAGEGTPVIALKPGVCILSQPSSTAGEYVKIKHEDGVITTYMHFTKRLVKVNDEIKIGTVIGLVGNTGLSFGAHLHWEYTPAGGKSPTNGASFITNYFAFANKSILNSKPV